MKIIFSRKGFDSSTGGVPSPIFPDGRIISLPIPRASSIAYADLRFDGASIGNIVEDLAKGRLRAEDTCHLDPDLREDVYPRAHGWRPIFGQKGASAKHLLEHGISPGDLFLFFGWFREIEISEGTYRYIRGASDLHVLFGWLQVDKILRQGDTPPEWATYHPHFREDFGPDNLIFIGRRELELDGANCGVPGAAAFPEYRDELCLTAAHRSRSWWSLPAWFYPSEAKRPLSHHEDLSRWHAKGNHVYLQTAARGQEFILHANQYPESVPWVQSLIRIAAQ